MPDVAFGQQHFPRLVVIISLTHRPNQPHMSISSVIKIALATALVLLFVFGALGPAKLQFRPGVGWQLEHFVGYFVVTFVLCLMWPRRLLVGGGLMALALLLEGLQALTPDRCCDLETALYSVGGVMAALLPADMSIRALER